MTELEIRLLNVAYQLQDVYQDIEAYCPPDDSESWSEDAPSLFASRDELEQEFRGLIDTIRQEAVKDFVDYMTVAGSKTDVKWYLESLKIE